MKKTILSYFKKKETCKIEAMHLGICEITIRNHGSVTLGKNIEPFTKNVHYHKNLCCENIC